MNVNTIGTSNTALGQFTLQNNTTGINNTAIGANVLQNNITGTNNTALGYNALAAVGSGSNNTAVGASALATITTGTSNNTAVGASALAINTTGANNTAIGNGTLPLVTTGATNIAIGSGAGGTLTTGSGNIYINANAGSATEATTIRIGTSQTACFIKGINGVNQGGPSILGVFCNSNGQLGTQSSSIRYKHNIQDMEDASVDILKLRPVTFIFNDDKTESTQYGLIAEEVDEIFPNIVVRNNNNEIDAVQYHVLPILLLNEMKKQQATIEELKKDNNKRDALIQSLMKRLELLEARM
jgi:hypothetical protein